MRKISFVSIEDLDDVIVDNLFELYEFYITSIEIKNTLILMRKSEMRIAGELLDLSIKCVAIEHHVMEVIKHIYFNVAGIEKNQKFTIIFNRHFQLRTEQLQ